MKFKLSQDIWYLIYKFLKPQYRIKIYHFIDPDLQKQCLLELFKRYHFFCGCKNKKFIKYSKSFNTALLEVTPLFYDKNYKFNLESLSQGDYCSINVPSWIYPISYKDMSKFSLGYSIILPRSGDIIKQIIVSGNYISKIVLVAKKYNQFGLVFQEYEIKTLYSIPKNKMLLGIDLDLLLSCNYTEFSLDVFCKDLNKNSFIQYMFLSKDDRRMYF